jgi:predicted metalloprotease with PDZ domain
VLLKLEPVRRIRPKKRIQYGFGVLENLVTFAFFHRRRVAALLAATCLVLTAATTTAYAQDSAGPQPVPLPPPVVAPADTAYSGTISLIVDITNITDRVINVHETIPVTGGEITLLYPEWLPGTHSPSNPLVNMAGLTVSANGRRVDWIRDRVNVYAFHIDLPQDVKTLEVNFQYLAPQKPQQGRISSNFANLSWNTALLYPAGYFSRRIQFAPTLKLPAGWRFATALEVKSQDGNSVQFKDTTLNTLVDSPVYAGVNYKRVDLSSSPDNQVFLDVFADKPADLAITPEELQYHKNLVIEAQKLFNSHHYSHYDFLFSLSDTVSGKGLEHHQSSEDGTRANYFTDWMAGVPGRALLAHEYTHSWNGKFRRPADLWTPNFNVPMQNDLLWVYEGLTDYYGNVLTARSGLRTPEQERDLFAQTAANFEISPGRTWRPLVDTTNEPIISSHGASPETWPSWQRSYDYYPESDLIWLEADTKIRELSGGKKSLDDFAKLFYGMDNGSYITKTYTFDDLVTALNTVQAYDWAGFLRARVYDLAPQVPEGGITNGGYRLVYNDNAPDWIKHGDNPRGTSFATSLGLSVTPDGSLDSVYWDSPAFKAGITPDMQLQAVNDQKFSVATLREAILSAEKGNEPINLLLKREDQFVTVMLDYHGGLRYPHLERVAATPDRLDAILAPSK